MVEVNDSVESSDGSLRVTLISFDPRNGKGRIRIEELRTERGRFYVTVKYGSGGQMRIDYKTYDLHKSSDHLFAANPNEIVSALEIVRTVAD